MKHSTIYLRELKNQQRKARAFFQMINFTFFRGRLVLHRIGHKLYTCESQQHVKECPKTEGFYDHKRKHILIHPYFFAEDLVLHELAHLLTRQVDKCSISHRRTYQKNLVWLFEIFICYEAQRRNIEVTNKHFSIR